MDNLRIIAVTNEELVLSVSAMSDDILRGYFSSYFTTKQIDEMLDHSFSPDALISEINNGHEYFLISYDYTFAGISSIIEKGDTLLLDKLFIHSEFEDKGLYLVMIEKYIELCKLRNLKKIHLLCDKNNTLAFDIYRKAGFEIIGSDTLKLDEHFETQNHVLEYIIK